MGTDTTKGKIDWAAIDREILAKLDLQAEFAALGIRLASSTPNAGGWLAAYAIDRQEASPSAAVNVASNNGALGKYTDLATGNQAVSLWELAVKAERFSDWREARAHYADRAGVKLPKGKASGKGGKSAAVAMKLPLRRLAITPELVARINAYAASRQTTGMVFHVAGGIPADFNGHEVLAFPVYLDGTIVGWILYRIDGQPFAAYGDLPERKTHCLAGSADGWSIVGRNAAGEFVSGQAALDACGTLWRVEGLPDLFAIAARLPAGNAVASNIFGAGAAAKLPMDDFTGKDVIAIGDQDTAGQAGNEKFCKAAAKVAKSVSTVTLPYPMVKKHGPDVRDYFKDGHTFDELLALVKPWAPAAAGPAGKGDAGEIREIVIDTDEHRVNDEAAAAIAGDEGLFQHAGQLVQISYDTSPTAGVIRPPNSPRIVRVTLPTLRERMTSRAQFKRVVGDERKNVHPPEWCTKGVHSRHDWPGMRHLEGVVSHPILRADGTVLATPGYDPATGLLLASQDKISVPDFPTIADARRACELLFDVVKDFPFAKPMHRSAWLAFVLTPLARFAFSGPVPLFLADANVRGSGKTLLLELVSIIVTGLDFARVSNTTDSIETRKLITALVIACDLLVLIDNVDGVLGCAALDAALTATTWKDRILGRSETIEMPMRITFAASGNNIVVLADTTRRICHIRLESPMERPEEREGFTHPNLLQHVRQHRPELLAAALTILRAYCVAGRPKAALKPWGSFEGWSNLIRQAIVWCGHPDPGDTRVDMAEHADTDAGNLRTIINNWPAFDPTGEGLTAAEILQKIGEENIVPGTFDTMAGRDFTHKAIREAILEWCPGHAGKLPSARSLGMKLKHIRRRVINGHAIDSRRNSEGVMIWKLVEAENWGAEQEALSRD